MASGSITCTQVVGPKIIVDIVVRYLRFVGINLTANIISGAHFDAEPLERWLLYGALPDEVAEVRRSVISWLRIVIRRRSPIYPLQHEPLVPFVALCAWTQKQQRSARSMCCVCLWCTHRSLQGLYRSRCAYRQRSDTAYPSDHKCALCCTMSVRAGFAGNAMHDRRGVNINFGRAPPSTMTMQKSSVTMAAPVRWFSDALTSTLNRFCGLARLPTCVAQVSDGDPQDGGRWVHSRSSVAAVHCEQNAATSDRCTVSRSDKCCIERAASSLKWGVAGT